MAATERIHVNCLVPHWIGTTHIQAVVAATTPEERREAAVRAVLILPEELTAAETVPLPVVRNPIR
jgi:hypothetical protein